MEPRTHYQISLTARQAVGLFVGLLLALGLAFFFGLMTGYSGRRTRETPEPAVAHPAAPEALPAVETAVPTARPETVAVLETPAPAGEVTPPPTLQTFEDGGAEEPFPPPATARPGAPTPKPGAAGKPTPAAGRVWVQVASVSSRAEADALTSRLGKHGYHTVVATEKGRLRVRVGPYRTTEDARRAAERLRKQEKVKSPWVVFEGK